MEAHRTQSPHLAKAQAPVVETTQHQGLRGITRRGMHFVSMTAYPWCKDHMLSVAVLLGVSAGISIYYGAHHSTDTSPVLDYGDEKGFAEFQSSPLRPVQQITKAAASSRPDLSDPLPPLVFAVASEDADLTPPLPLSADHPKPRSQANASPALNWPGHTNTAQCVWLTGSIEPEEAKPDVIQYVSRVHELTRPAQKSSTTNAKGEGSAIRGEKR